MKQIRAELDDELHRRVRIVAVSKGLTLQQALAEGAKLYAEAGEKDLREIATAMSASDKQPPWSERGWHPDDEGHG